MSKLYCGIDPGKEGFLTTYFDETDTWKHFEVPKIGKFVDVNELAAIFDTIATPMKVFSNIQLIVGMEDVHAIYGSSAKATFGFGYVCGMMEGMIVANKLPFVKIQPKKWQKDMWAGVPIQKKPSSTGKTMVTDTKLVSLMAAKRLFPDIDFRRNERCKVPDNNKVDSVLICEYMKRNY